MRQRGEIQGKGTNSTGQTNAIEVKNPVFDRYSWHLTLQLLGNLDILINFEFAICLFSLKSSLVVFSDGKQCSPLLFTNNIVFSGIFPFSMFAFLGLKRSLIYISEFFSMLCGFPFS